MAGAFDQPVLASAAIDRLAHGAIQITITGESYRAKELRKGEEVTKKLERA